MPDKDNSDTHFNKDCTFVPLPDMWFTSFFAFESVSKPSYFIRLAMHGELVLEKYDGTSDFKQVFYYTDIDLYVIRINFRAYQFSHKFAQRG